MNEPATRWHFNAAELTAFRAFEESRAAVTGRKNIGAPRRSQALEICLEESQVTVDGEVFPLGDSSGGGPDGGRLVDAIVIDGAPGCIELVYHELGPRHVPDFLRVLRIPVPASAQAAAQAFADRANARGPADGRDYLRGRWADSLAVMGRDYRVEGERYRKQWRNLILWLLAFGIGLWLIFQIVAWLLPDQNPFLLLGGSAVFTILAIKLLRPLVMRD